MTVVLFIFAGAFCLKILWNLLIPYVLAWRSLDSEGRTKGVSLIPAIEVGLFLVTLSASMLAKGSTWLHSAKNVGIGGAVVLLGSYLHLFLAGTVVGWVVAKYKRKRPPRLER